MWLSLVTAIVSAVLADAGYLYNAPSVPSRLVYPQPAAVHTVYSPRPQDVKTIQGIQEEDKSISYSISYKDYVYLKKDSYNTHQYPLNINYNNVQAHSNPSHVSNNAGILPIQNLQSNVGHSNNGYAAPLTPVVNLNNNYVQHYSVPASNPQHHHHRVPINHVNTNAGLIQTNHPPTSYNNYVQSTGGATVHNTGYAQTSSAPIVNNQNSYSQTAGSVAPAVNLNNVYVQTAIPSGGNNLNNGFINGGYVQTPTPQTNSYLNTEPSQSVQTNAPLNVGYSHLQAPLNNGYSHVQINAPLNNGYSQVAQVNTPLSNVYSQATPVSTPVSNVYSQANVPLNNGQSQVAIASAGASSGLDSNNGYTYSVSSSAGSNTGYAQASTSSISANLNNGYAQTLAPAGAANLNTAFDTTATSSGSNALAPALTSTATSVSSTGYSGVSSGPTHVDLNLGSSQSLATSSLGAGIGQTLTSGSDNLNNGLVQSNINAQINPSPASPPVTPIIHKHIYFHVPPPEIEEPEKVLPPPPPPKKNYKILFIKVPSQESKSNLVRLQQQIEQMKKDAVEEKTLIYVLVKNPESPKPVVLPEPKPSDHQVYFVKYGGNPFDIASQVNDELDKTGTVQSIVPLEPGLINGQHE